MPTETLMKQPAEVLHRSLTFNGLLTITALHSVAAEARGLVAGSALITVTYSLLAGAVTLAIAGGTDGESYLVTALADDADGQRAEAELQVVVIDAAWVMPDGGAPWLSIADFVKAVGLPEVVRATDGVGDGRIDRDLLVSALVSAQAIAQAHVAGRFAVSPGAVPEILKLIVTDLTRARLYSSGMPEGVERAEKSAMRMLERIQSGAMPLGDASVPEAPTDNPILISPGRRAYPDGLADY
ncbi:MAG TPA: phage protein Gp36 family protein [Sphingobium sp.]